MSKTNRNSSEREEEQLLSVNLLSATRGAPASSPASRTGLQRVLAPATPTPPTDHALLEEVRTGEGDGREEGSTGRGGEGREGTEGQRSIRG